MVVLVVMVDCNYGAGYMGAGWDRDFPESAYPDKGPRRLGDGVTGAAVVGTAVPIVVHSGWLAASRPPVVSGLK